jgi:SAM-dependent methyltransferase
MTAARQHFEQMYQADPDPWCVVSSWYERRKRDLLLASLPREHYAHGFEPGCGNGEATQRLLQRCGRLCAVDFSDRAVGLCRERIPQRDRARLDLQALSLPWQWPKVPQDGFDLLVVSELAYYFDDAALAHFNRQCMASLQGGGHWLMCHWRHDAHDRLQTTQALHDSVASHGGLRLLLTHTEPDFQLDIWQKNP